MAAREAGGLADRPATRPRLIDAFLPKVEEWMERSNGQIRADVVHDKLLGMGFPGAERTTRRAVRTVRRAFKAGRVRVHRPWVTEPGKQRNGKLAVRRSPVSPIYRNSTPKRTANLSKPRRLSAPTRLGNQKDRGRPRTCSAM